MKVIIAGGSGFLGNALQEYFEKLGNQVLILTRSPKSVNDVFWDGKTIGKWAAELENADVLINLTGKSVDCRYTEANKKAILDSRINSTVILQQAWDTCKNPPKTWLNASSATIYIHAETELMTEGSGRVGDDFSMNICKKWEAVFFQDKREGLRKVALRTSIVLGKDGGAFPKLKLVAKLGLGGKQGRGNQQVSWVHIEDFCRAVDFVIQNDSISEFVNITSPNPISNKAFMESLRNSIKMPFGIPSPVFLLEIASIFLRTETELLLKSRNVYPEKLLHSGFKLGYSIVSDGFEDLR